MEIRIFISSPGDVVAERAIAKRVIRKLQKELGNAVELKPLLWEDMPLQSTSTFQEGIDKIEYRLDRYRYLYTLVTSGISLRT